MTARQRQLALGVAAAASLAAFALNAGIGMLPKSDPSPTGQPSTALPTLSLVDPVPRMALVYDVAGRGTAGFNELAWEGTKRAADALGADLKEVTAMPGDTDADREARLKGLADAHYDPIFVIGASYAGPLTEIAPKYPSIRFGIVDVGSVDAPNVIGIQFHEEQGSFLVGAAAALTSKTGNVGFLGAAKIPRLQAFEAGFTAGARAANPGIKVQVAYLVPVADYPGSIDSARVKQAASGMYAAGADVIFGVAGDSGNGVIQAAHDRGLWAIGVDSDQYLLSDATLRGAVLTSMVKRADVAMYKIAEEVANGVAKDGNNVFGVDVGGVAYSTSGGFVDAIKGQLDAFAARIASGEILVPTKP